MGDHWIIDLNDYPEDDEDFSRLPNTAINLVLHLRSIVEWMTTKSPDPEFELTNVYCRRSPGRKRCVGQVLARFSNDPDGICWECPACGDGGFINGWQGTEWDRR